MSKPRPSDQEVALHILAIFAAQRVRKDGFLTRADFFQVRDGDFRRGLDRAIANGWVRLNVYNRYRYILTAEGADEISTAMTGVSA